MKEINYLEIIKKSWKITWKNKYLWWFGLFLALGGGFNFNLPGNGEWDKKIGRSGVYFENFISQHWQLVASFIVLAVIAGLALFVLSLIAKAGLLKVLDKIEKNSSMTFKEGFKEGKKYFWKLLAIGLILGTIVFALLVILAVPVVLLFSIKALALGISSALLAFVIFIPLMVLTAFIGKYSVYYITLSDLRIKESMENAYQIFKRNILTSIVMSLFFIPISIALFALIMFFLLIIGLAFLLIGTILYLMFSKAGIIIAVTSGIFVFVLSLILANSVYQVFSQTVWYLFFKEIASAKEEEKIEEKVSEIDQKSIPAPEEA